MFHYDPNRELYLGFRKIAERMSAREVGDRVEEVSSSGEVSAETSRAVRLMRNRGRRTKIRIDGATSMNVRDHAPRVIKKLSRGAVELRDMCDPLVGRIASYSGFGMMGRRCRGGVGIRMMHRIFRYGIHVIQILSAMNTLGCCFCMGPEKATSCIVDLILSRRFALALVHVKCSTIFDRVVTAFSRTLLVFLKIL